MKINKENKALLLRFFRNDCSEKEVEQLSDWISLDKGGEEITSILDELWDQAKNCPDSQKPDTHKIYNEIKSKIDELEIGKEHLQNKRKIINFKDKRLLQKVARIAAVFLISALVLGAGYYLHNHATNKEANDISVFVPYGQKKQLSLPDGTRVWINSGSSISYPKKFQKKYREVKLSGEAYFDVTKDAHHPFIVETNEVNIEVLGTAFNVSAYPGGRTIKTTLVRGKVLAYHNSSKEIITDHVFLFPGEQAVYFRQQKNFQLKKVNAKLAGSWKDGKLLFNDTPLSEVVKSLNRWYNVDIQIQDPGIENYVYSVDFEKEPLDWVEKILSEVTPIRFVHSGKQIFVVKDKKKYEDFINRKKIH